MNCNGARWLPSSCATSPCSGRHLTRLIMPKCRVEVYLLVARLQIESSVPVFEGIVGSLHSNSNDIKFYNQKEAYSAFAVNKRPLHTCKEQAGSVFCVALCRRSSRTTRMQDDLLRRSEAVRSTTQAFKPRASTVKAEIRNLPKMFEDLLTKQSSRLDDRLHRFLIPVGCTPDIEKGRNSLPYPQAYKAFYTRKYRELSSSGISIHA